jgi:catechol 2,3-dioxygenase-like lactoylglutathione lyase family enzyme
MIHHVQLSAPAGSERAARAFWGDSLGFEEVAKPPALAARGGC